MIRQACADEVKIKLVSALGILYSLLFVAFFTDITFNVTWVYECVCV
jgi:hypothetical protein